MVVVVVVVVVLLLSSHLCLPPLVLKTESNMHCNGLFRKEEIKVDRAYERIEPAEVMKPINKKRKYIF